jgi:hypothetical protein
VRRVHLISCCIEYAPGAVNYLQTGKTEFWPWNEGISGELAVGGLTSHEVNPGSEIDRVAVGDVRDSTPGQGSDALGLVGPMGGEFGVG